MLLMWRDWPHRENVPHSGKLPRGWVASSTRLSPHPNQGRQCLPTVSVAIKGVSCIGLIDSGSSATVLVEKLVAKLGLPLSKRTSSIRMLNGVTATVKTVSQVRMKVKGVMIEMECLVADELVEGMDAILGMDCIRRLGGVTLAPSGVSFGCEEPAVVAGGSDGGAVKPSVVAGPGTSEASNLEVEDQDFEAKIDGTSWTVRSG